MDKNIGITILIGCLLIFVIFKIVGFGIKGAINLLLKSILLPIKYMVKGIVYILMKIMELIKYLIRNVLPKILDKLKYAFFWITKSIYKCLQNIYKLLTLPFRKIKRNVNN